MSIKEELIEERLLQLKKERKSTCIDAKNMFWSPQKKEKHKNNERI